MSDLEDRFAKLTNAVPENVPEEHEDDDDTQEVATVWKLDLSPDDPMEDIENFPFPSRPKDLPKSCFIKEDVPNDGKHRKVLKGEDCYDPTWTGKTDEDGNKSITCMDQDTIDDMWRKHYQDNEKLKQELKKSVLDKNPELQEVLSKAKEGDLIEDISKSGYRTTGVHILKRNSEGTLEVEDLDSSIDDYGMVGRGFSLGPKYPVGYWNNALFEKAYWHSDPLEEPVHRDILSNLRISDLDEEEDWDMVKEKTVPFTYAFFEWGALRFPGNKQEVFNKIQDDIMYDDDLAYFEEVKPNIAQIVHWQWER